MGDNNKEGEPVKWMLELRSPVLRVYAPKKTGARSALAYEAAKTHQYLQMESIKQRCLGYVSGTF